MSFINRKGKTSAHRKMVMRQQVSDVLSHGHIVTTSTYAFRTRSSVERLITLAKNPTLANRRAAASILLGTNRYDKDELLRKLFSEIAEKYKTRNGGYCRKLRMRGENRFLISLV